MTCQDCGRSVQGVPCDDRCEKTGAVGHRWGNVTLTCTLCENDIAKDEPFVPFRDGFIHLYCHTKPAPYEKLGSEIGAMTDSKAAQYGQSAEKSTEVFRVLYPNGIPTHAYANALLVIRVIDKLCRIANQGEDGRDKGGESPWRDIAGYGLIGLKMTEPHA